MCKEFRPGNNPRDCFRWGLVDATMMDPADIQFSEYVGGRLNAKLGPIEASQANFDAFEVDVD